MTTPNSSVTSMPITERQPSFRQKLYPHTGPSSMWGSFIEGYHKDSFHRADLGQSGTACVFLFVCLYVCVCEGEGRMSPHAPAILTSFAGEGQNSLFFCAFPRSEAGNKRAAGPRKGNDCARAKFDINRGDFLTAQASTGVSHTQTSGRSIKVSLYLANKNIFLEKACNCTILGQLMSTLELTVRMTRGFNV